MIFALRSILMYANVVERERLICVIQLRVQTDRSVYWLIGKIILKRTPFAVPDNTVLHALLAAIREEA